MSNRSPFRKMSLAAIAAAALCTLAGNASATPSTQIWIPSTDVQPFKTVHLNVDSYIRTKNNPDGTRSNPLYVIGPTFGVSPVEKLQVEVGFDLMYSGATAAGPDGGTVNLDSNPFYGHAKIGTPEDALFKGSPALAAGIYNAGTRRKVTDQNIAYAEAAKTIPVLGRISAGWFVGNSYLLNDAQGDNDASGVLLSWDRTMTEISDKLWLAVDYQGTKSAMGALSFGASWAFAKNVSVILGYDVYNSKTTGGQNTATVQVDINFP